MQMGAKPIDCIIHGGDPRAENTDVITNFLSRKRKLLLLLIVDNFPLAKYEYFYTYILLIPHMFFSMKHCDKN